MNEDRDGGRSTPESSISQSNRNRQRAEMFAVLAFGIAILLTIFLARSFKGIEYNQVCQSKAYIAATSSGM